MRLSHVLIERFRGIGRLEIELDDVTAIIGENNTGKTSLFDVLALLLGRGEALARRSFRGGDFHVRASGRAPGPIRVVLTFEELATDAWVSGGVAAQRQSDAPAFLPAIGRDRAGRRRARVGFTGDPGNGRIRGAMLDEEGRAVAGIPDAAIESLLQLHPLLLLRFAQPAARPAVEGDRVEKRGRLELEGQIARVYRDLAGARGPVPSEELVAALNAARDLYADLAARAGTGASPMRRMLEHLVGPAEDGSIDRERIARAGSGSQTLGMLMVLGALLDVRGVELLPDQASPLIAIEEPEVHLHPILLATTWNVIEGLGAQTLVTTHSGELLSSVPMERVRRLVRRDDRIDVHRLHAHTLSDQEQRRVGYHIGAKRGGVLFARCWLLVEGETEFWILRQLAHVLGYDLEAEGVRVVEFAQCGIAPLVKLANDLGIEWHLLADGDESGAGYAREAREALDGASQRDRISRLGHRDIETCFWHHGYEEIYTAAAHPRGGGHAPQRKASPGRVIAKAAKVTSKPFLAQAVAEAVAGRGPEGVPDVVARVIRTVVRLARDSSTDGSEVFDR